MPPEDRVDTLIAPALRRLQDVHGWLSNDNLARLADTMKVPLSRVEEVVSFFPHFRRSPPPNLEVRVCRDMTCHLRGAPALLSALRYSYPEGSGVSVQGVSCLGRCDRAPVLSVDRFAKHNGSVHADVHDALYAGRNPAQAAALVSALASGGVPPAVDTDAAHAPPNTPWRADPYPGSAHEPYAAARKLLRELRTADGPAERAKAVDKLLGELRTSTLRGMGGAGLPAAGKWQDVRDAEGSEKYIVCNADESEPGTFKDRELLLRTPHLIVEGMALAALACGASRGYVYVRHEYPEQVKAVRQAIRLAEAAGVCGARVGNTDRSFFLDVFVSPGGYICGEQSALLEAMESRRAQPRNRPPELATNGLFNRPTLVSNVETFAWAPSIYLNGGKWYCGLGYGAEGVTYARGEKAYQGARFFSISGDLVRPGVYEVPIGLPLRELVCGDKYAQGVSGGRALAAVAPSGPSGGMLPARIALSEKMKAAIAGLPKPSELRRKFEAGQVGEELDVLDLELELELFRNRDWLNLGSMLGAGLVVYAEGTDIPSQALNFTQFFRNETCGKCVPCRLGTQRLAEIGGELVSGRVSLDQIDAVRDEVKALDEVMESTSICGLGAVAPKALATLLQYFEDEIPQRPAGR